MNTEYRALLIKSLKQAQITPEKPITPLFKATLKVKNAKYPIFSIFANSVKKLLKLD